MEANFKAGDSILGELATEVWETCRAANEPAPANSVAGRYVLSSIIASIKSKVASTEQVTAPEQEGGHVAWLITDKNINEIQVASIQRLIDRCRHAHHTDLIIRINGHDEHYEADWLKHLVRTASAERAPVVGLMKETIKQAAEESGFSRIEQCCADTLKFCATDQWKGNIEGFAKALLRLTHK